MSLTSLKKKGKRGDRKLFARVKRGVSRGGSKEGKKERE